MRQLIACLTFFASAAFASPASAETLDEVTTRGIVARVQGFQMEMDFTPDNRFTAMNGRFRGVWRIDGDRLCTIDDGQPVERCTVYPPGKRSGDTFEVTNHMGMVITVQIK